MTKINSQIKKWVIREYKSGKTLDEVATNTNLSKGAAYNIVKEWKSQLGEGNVEEVRMFSRSLKKSGITLLDCVMGLRIYNMLIKFNLHDDFENLS